jgi:transposase
VNDILQLKRQGLSISQIAAFTGFSRRTVRKYLAQPSTPRYPPRAPRPTKLDPFKPFLHERLQAGLWNAVVLLAQLQERGYEGGYTILTDYLRPLRQQALTVAVRRFETPPGHQAQVDWGHLGHLEGASGKQAISIFVCTLGHSRACFADLSLDQTLPTFLRMHEGAFAAFGGVPREILYDRPKTVLLGQDERGELIWQPTFAEFARYWGFVPRLCRPYRPQTKGKVENGIGYVRKNFLCGRQADDFSQLRAGLRLWVDEVALQRVHGTTHQRVWDALAAEKPHLLPLAGRAPFSLLLGEPRRVAKDAYVSYRANRYSVPWRVVGHEVWLREVDGQLEISREGERLALHSLGSGRHQVITVAAHHQDMPMGSQSRRGKAQIVLRQRAPQVEVRPLSVYEALAVGGA